MRAIGGYFDFEMCNRKVAMHRRAALRLKSGRSCLKWLAGFERPKRILLPYYSCDAVLEGLEDSGAEISFYEIDSKFELGSSLIPEDACLIYINFFGLKSHYAEQLETEMGRRLWLDETHAYFSEPTTPKAWHFNSVRKFFGVPDGAFLYAPTGVAMPTSETFSANTDYRFEHLHLRSLGRVEEGFPAFQDNERRNGGPIAGMSELTESLLGSIDFASAARKREENFVHVHQLLGPTNRINSMVLNSQASGVPFCYPYLPPKPVNRQALAAQKIFVPMFWRECANRCSSGFEWERQLSNELLPLPVDHRYDAADMERVAKVIQSNG